MRSFFALVLLAFSAAVNAQSYPSRPITLVVPYTPGTGIDIIARTVGPKITERWGQAVVVDNKPGASGNIGAQRSGNRNAGACRSGEAARSRQRGSTPPRGR
jgi:tripartite-type tricarboxylate transporter receptor subunit TctC